MAGCVGADLQAMRIIEIADSLQKGKGKGWMATEYRKYRTTLDSDKEPN